MVSPANFLYIDHISVILTLNQNKNKRKEKNLRHKEK